MKRAPSTRRGLGEQLRDLVNDRGLSGYALAKACGVPRSVVNRFLAGGGLTLDTLDAIAAAMGLRLVETARRTARRAPARAPVSLRAEVGGFVEPYTPTFDDP